MAATAFAERLSKAMTSAGMKQADLIRAAAERGRKLGKSQVSQYVSGKTLPRHDVLALLAQILQVEEAWLAGKAVEAPARATTRHEAATTASPRERTSTRHAAHEQRSTTMRTFKKSSKLDNVLYDVRGPVADEAARMEAEGLRILKLNIGNPAPFGFRTPDEVIQDMRQQLPECEGYSDSRGLFSARKAIMQYAQLKGLPNVSMDGIYTGNGVSELIQLCMNALLDTGDEVLIPSPYWVSYPEMVKMVGGVKRPWAVFMENIS